MAYVVWRRGGTRVYLYYYDNKAGRLIQAPRELTKEWDGLPRDEVYEKKRQWEEDHGQTKDRISRVILRADDKLTKLWGAYQAHQMKFKKRRPSTAHRETESFTGYICTFFVKTHRKKDPTKWHDLVPDFHNWLVEQSISDSYMRSILWTLERFGRYLVFARMMTFPFTIQTPTRNNSKVTPLKVRLSPEEVLELVNAVKFKRTPKKHASHIRTVNINFKLAILVGYFASLRPEELYALDREDFLTGLEAVNKSKTYSGLKDEKLGSKLAVRINKTIISNKVEAVAKTHYSYGYVTIWHPEAARLIAEILKDAEPGRLFPFSRGWLDRAWREMVKPMLGATAHDLRRASGLYLGRVKRIPLTLLQEHMRHAEIETTMLYTRAPTIELEEKHTVIQDFDDVV
jgi:integrase